MILHICIYSVHCTSLPEGSRPLEGPVKRVGLADRVLALRATHVVTANQDSDDHHRRDEDENGHKTNHSEDENCFAFTESTCVCECVCVCVCVCL